MSTTYIYTAKKNTAETVQGQIKANSHDEAIELINHLGLLPISVDERTEDQEVKVDLKNRRIKSKELYVFNRQLSNLLKSGMPLLRALLIIKEQTQNIAFRNVISNLADQIKNGNSFSESLKTYPKIFSHLYINMVYAGEESGNLQEILKNVSAYQKKQEELSSKIRTALAYPIFMAVMGIASIYFMLTFVLPKMTNLFTNIGDALPTPTVIILTLSDLLSKYWAIILLVVLVISFFILRLKNSQSGRFISSQIVLRLPFIGDIFQKAELARFCRTIILLLKSGSSVVRALNISIPMMSNELIKNHLIKCKEDLTAGGSFGESIKQSGVIPVMMGHLISLGEESGNLNDVLSEIAETYEQETDEKIKIMTTLLEPIMILAVGLIIGFMVFAMLLPIFQVDVFSY